MSIRTCTNSKTDTGHDFCLREAQGLEEGLDEGRGGIRTVLNFLFLIVGNDFPVVGIDGLNLPNELDHVRISAVCYYFKFLSSFQWSLTSSNLLLMQTAGLFCNI